MNVFYKMYCRAFQGVLSILLPMMPYREPKRLERVDDIAPELQKLEINKVLVVTDKGIRSAGLLDIIERGLSTAQIQYEIFDDVVPNPTSVNVEKSITAYQNFGAKALIAVGGGSVIDCAKALGARINNPEKPLNKMEGLMKVKKKLPPLFAVPTTAGTGSETTPSAVIVDHITRHKYVITDFDLIPSHAVLDARLTLSLPPMLTATTAMDALTHAVEAFIGRTTTDQSRKNALEAVRLIMENLPRVMEDGSNERARSNLLKASYLAGLAFSRSFVGYVHAISHSLSGKYDAPHGLLNAVILPYVLAEYGDEISDKLKTMAVYSGVAKVYDSEYIATSKFINKILDMNEEYGIPKSFDFIETDDIPDLSKTAVKEANPLYPVPKLFSAKELEKIYYKLKS